MDARNLDASSLNPYTFRRPPALARYTASHLFHQWLVSLKHYVPLFNNFTDISEERQQLKQLSWRVSYLCRKRRKVSMDSDDRWRPWWETVPCNWPYLPMVSHASNLCGSLRHRTKNSRRRKEAVWSKSRGQVPREHVVQRGNHRLLAQKYVEEAKHVWSTRR